MELGNFSVSLAVKDIKASTAFYEALGFSHFGGDADQGWLILKNADTVIGLFQGMFDKNMLTFNPGWKQGGGEVDGFTDVRELQATLKAKGIELAKEVDTGETGPGSIMLTDPDGNPVLIDQHV